ncbi:MAG: nucleotidyltransferase family protein [Eubacteriales bacterium]
MLDAIVIAGSPNSGLLRECSDEAYEALIGIGSKPMIRYVVDALIESQNVNKIAISGPAELKEVFPEDFIEVVEIEGTIIGNAVKALARVDTTHPVLITTCDIPLLTASAVNDFLRLCSDQDIDFFYPIVSMEEVQLHFPGIKRTSAKLQEGTFTGGNLFIVNPAAVPRSAAKAQEFVNFRKSPLKLSRLLGLEFVFKLLFSRLTIPELEKKVSEILGIKVKAVITLYPEIGIDVDKPSDYLIASSYLDKPA